MAAKFSVRNKIVIDFPNNTCNIAIDADVMLNRTWVQGDNHYISEQLVSLISTAHLSFGEMCGSYFATV